MIMARMIDEFSTLKQELLSQSDPQSEDALSTYQAALVYEQFVSYANNCHGKNAQETLSYLGGMVEWAREYMEYSPAEREALDNVEILIDLYMEDYS